MHGETIKFVRWDDVQLRSQANTFKCISHIKVMCLVFYILFLHLILLLFLTRLQSKCWIPINCCCKV